MEYKRYTNILLVEDNPADAFLVGTLLDELPNQEFNVQHVKSLSEAKTSIEEDAKLDIILLDLSLPDARGTDAISEISAIAPNAPIVIMTGNQDPAIVDAAVQAGAQDFLLKGESDARLLDKTIRYAIEHKRTEHRLSLLAHYDTLTSLANRTLFSSTLNRALARAKRYHGFLGLLFLDLDRFKPINDNLGHDAGDELLRQVAGRIQKVIREGDLPARLGGDEFAIILEGIKSISTTEMVAEKILNAISKPYILGSHEAIISASIGIATYPAAGDTTKALLKNADIAMYRAKEQGRNNYQVYNNEINRTGLEHLDMEHDLHHALERDELILHYQPVIDVGSGDLVSVETLLRWKRPGHEGLVPPLDFIPILEETGLIVSVGEWVLRTACLQCKAWQNAGLHDLRIAVNISPLQLREPRCVEKITRAIDDSGLDPRYIDLEITESTLIDQSCEMNTVLDEIRNTGVNLSMDDFGTGYSSLSYLIDFKLDTLKIDRSFLHGLTASGPKSVIVKAIIEMAHGLGLKVIAEGVEKGDQLNFLRAVGCDEVQGFLFSSAVEAQAIPGYKNPLVLHKEIKAG